MAIQPFEFPKYRPRPVEVNKSDEGQMSSGNLSHLLGQVSKTSSVEIDNLIGNFEGLRSRLQTDRERIQREIEEYHALSQQVVQLTSIISDSVAQLPTAHTSVDRGRTH